MEIKILVSIIVCLVFVCVVLINLYRYQKNRPTEKDLNTSEHPQNLWVVEWYAHKGEFAASVEKHTRAFTVREEAENFKKNLIR